MGLTVDLLEPESPELLSWIFKKFPRNAGLFGDHWSIMYIVLVYFGFGNKLPLT